MTSNNVVLIVLDAVRADHLSCYGYDRTTTPNIDRIASEGVRYEHTFSNSNWTGAAHPPIFTGELPSNSGIYSGDLSFSEDTTLLTELLKESGYRTFGTSAGAYIRQGHGYDRGFDVFQQTHRIRPTLDTVGKLFKESPYRKQVLFSLNRGPDDKTLYKFESLKKFIDSDDDPFFAFFNCKTAHSPYNPPRPYKSMYCPELSRPSYEFLERLYNTVGMQTQKLSGADINKCRTDPGQFMTDEYNLTQDEWDVVKSWYDGAISYLDYRIGCFVDALRKRGELENTYLIITADHGEMFGEHGLTQHKYSLYDTLLHVPLIIRPPDPIDGRVLSDRVSLVDLFATILDMTDTNISDRTHSRSLLPLRDEQFDGYTFAEIGKQDTEALQRRHPNWAPPKHQIGPLQSIRDDEFKLIESPDGHIELYRWREDPGEETELSDEFPDVSQNLLKQLRSETSDMRTESEHEDIESESLRKTLEHLGYR